MTSILSSITSAFESAGTMNQTKLANITAESAKKLRQKYPDRIPVVISNVDNRVTLKKHKFLVPLDLTVGQLVYIIRRHAEKIQQSDALFIFDLNDSSKNLKKVFNLEGIFNILYHSSISPERQIVISAAL